MLKKNVVERDRKYYWTINKDFFLSFFPFHVIACNDITSFKDCTIWLEQKITVSILHLMLRSIFLRNIYFFLHISQIETWMVLNIRICLKIVSSSSLRYLIWWLPVTICRARNLKSQPLLYYVSFVDDDGNIDKVWNWARNRIVLNQFILW